MQIFLPILFSATVWFTGFTATEPDTFCYLTDNSIDVTQIYVADEDGWCEYRVRAGNSYTVRTDSNTVTFIAVNHDEEY